jgi:hypothetical protein
MSKTLITLLLGLFLTSPAWPQETATSGDADEPESVTAADTGAPDAAGGVGEAGEQGIAAEAAPTEVDETADIAEPDIVDPDFDDEELDEQTYEEDEDDFVPSEEIPADEPIPFPSNI